MKFREFGDPKNPCIMLIHGGGQSWWNFKRQADTLSSHYHVILPILDGHGEEFASEYKSTEDAAEKLLDYIDSNCNGHVFALGGVSLGGQIVMEMLSRRADFTQKAIIDGTLCHPQVCIARISIFIFKVFGKIMFSERGCRRQLAKDEKALPKKMHLPEDIKQLFIQDVPLMPIKTLVTVFQTYMIDYTLKDSVKHTTAQVQCWYGEKEMKIVKQSAQSFCELVPSCKIHEVKGCNHGELAIHLPDEWIALAKLFFDD